MALISGKGPRRVGVITRGIQLWTDPVCTDEELRRLYDGLVMFHGAAAVSVVEETTERKYIPYPKPPELPGELISNEFGRQTRKITTDWPTLERALVAKRGPLKNWADDRELEAPRLWGVSQAWRIPGYPPLLRATGQELELPGVVKEMHWTIGSRMVTIVYEIS